MLNARPIVDALAATMQLIPDLAAAMTVVDSSGNPSCRISAFHYLFGQEHRLAEAIYKMPAPSMFVAWDGTLGGNFDGQTIWKHRFNVYFRMGNAAGLAQPVGYEDLWSILCNQPPAGSQVNIRYMQIYPGLDIMDTPSMVHAVDEDLQDRFVCTLVIPEIGDN